jgi:hypothetical protein
VQDNFFSLAKVARTQPLTEGEERELQFYLAMLRQVDCSYENNQTYRTIYDDCVSQTFSGLSQEIITDYTPWAEVRLFSSLIQPSFLNSPVQRDTTQTKVVIKRTANEELDRWDQVRRPRCVRQPNSRCRR